MSWNPSDNRETKMQTSGGKGDGRWDSRWGSPEVNENWASWRELGECGWTVSKGRPREVGMMRKELVVLCSDYTGKRG